MKMKKLLTGLFIIGLISICGLSQATITSTFTSLKGPYAIGGYSRMATASLATSGTYVSGGFTLSPSSFGMSNIESVQLDAPSGYNFWWDRDNAKVVIYTNGTSTQPSGTTTITGVNIQVIGN